MNSKSTHRLLLAVPGTAAAHCNLTLSAGSEGAGSLMGGEKKKGGVTDTLLVALCIIIFLGLVSVIFVEDV
jgi:hypothetical protein